MIKPNLLDNDVPKENKNYTCIACITIDSAMRMDKKYKIKKTQISRFINTELDLDSESDDDSDNDSDNDSE